MEVLLQWVGTGCICLSSTLPVQGAVTCLPWWSLKGLLVSQFAQWSALLSDLEEQDVAVPYMALETMAAFLHLFLLWTTLIQQDPWPTHIGPRPLSCFLKAIPFPVSLFIPPSQVFYKQITKRTEMRWTNTIEFPDSSNNETITKFFFSATLLSTPSTLEYSFH